MNDLNWMENQLRSWKPRRPSPALKQRIFSAAPAGGGSASELVFGASWRWLAPVMGSFLLMLVLSSPKNADMGYFASATNHYLIERHASHAAFMGEGFHSRQNLADRHLFEWTNGPKPLEIPASATFVHTNTLIP